MKLAEARIMIERAARAKPALRALLHGKVTQENLPEVADACAELGLFELSQLLRDLETAEGPQKLAVFVASMDGGVEFFDELCRDFRAGADGDLGALVELFRAMR